jgi:prepilin-type N-terminal cleavage/methylation domain-containing protein
MKNDSAFSLVELLVVTAILCFLFALLFPVIFGVRGTALRVACANNLRQVALVCNAFAEDHQGALPQCNSANPGTFKFPVGTVVDRYMDDNGIPPNIWYCPTRRRGIRTPKYWMSHNTSLDKYNEFPIGYFYVGNPSTSSLWKFVQKVPVSIYNDNSNIELVFDISAARRPAPSSGNLIKEWSSFAHFSRKRPDGTQVLMGDFSLQYRHKSELKLGYTFVAPVNVYW